MRWLLAVLLGGVLAGCASYGPERERALALGAATFGTTEDLKVEVIPYSGPMSNALISNLSDSNQLSVASAMGRAAKKPVNLVVWSESPELLSQTMTMVVRYFEPGELPFLKLLYVGDVAQGEVLRPQVEALGAVYFVRADLDLVAGGKR